MAMPCAGTTRSSRRGLDSISTSPQWQSSCCNLSRLAWPMLTQVSPTASPLPRRRLGSRDRSLGAKMINNNWQVLGVGLMDTREIEKSWESSPAIPRELICPHGYDRRSRIMCSFTSELSYSDEATVLNGVLIHLRTFITIGKMAFDGWQKTLKTTYT